VASALGHYAARSSSQRLFNFLGSVHDLEALVTSRSAGSTMRALLLGHWLHLAVVLCWFAGIVVHTGFQANLDLWLDNPVRFGSIAHALWDPHFGSATFPVNELSASGFPFWARSVGFVTGGQLLAFGGALEAGSMASALLTSQPGRAFPFRCSAALLSTLSLLWAGHLSWVAAAPRPAQLLSFVGDLSPLSHAILLTDIIHHHVAVAVIGLWVSLSGAFGLAAGRSWLNSTPSGRGQLNRQVAVACLFLAFVVFWNAHIMLWLPSAGWIHFSLFSCNALFVHHLWIGSALAVGSCVHFSIAGIMPTTRALVPHLSWIGLFLGFHTLGIYVHNDVVFAFGDASKALLIQPIVVQSLQSYAGCFQWAANFCPADFLVQHAVALGIHTSLLILLQGGLSASRLDPDKRQRGFGFACDGPGRGGTCDISGWDSVYLASFWVLNTLGWLEVDLSGLLGVVLFLHRVFAKSRASFSATARQYFLSASFDWLSWLSLLAREATAFKSDFHVGAIPGRGACWFFSGVFLARHLTSSVLLLLGCVWSVRSAAVALSLIYGAGSTDGAGFCLCLLRCIRLGVAVSVALVGLFSWLTGVGRDWWRQRPALIARFKVSLSGLLLSPSSVLRSTQVLSLGLCSLFLNQRKHVCLISMRGSLGIVVSFN